MYRSLNTKYNNVNFGMIGNLTNRLCRTFFFGERVDELRSSKKSIHYGDDKMCVLLCCLFSQSISICTWLQKINILGWNEDFGKIFHLQVL